LLGGVFTDRISWRWCFYINLPIGALSIVVITFFLHIHRENNPDNLSIGQRILKLDLIGASVLIPAVICLLLALQWGGATYPWKSSRIIGLFIGFGLLISLFIFSQLKLGDKGTLPPRLFRNRNVALALAFAFVFGSGFFTLIFYLAIYFQSVKGSSATHAGIQLLPLLISTVFCSMLTGGLITAIGYYVPVMLFCMVLFAVGGGLITTFGLTTSFSKWFGYQVLAGLGIGVGFQGGVLVVQTVLPLSDVPVATACVSFFQVSLFPSQSATFLYGSREPGSCLKSDQNPFVCLTARETAPTLLAPMEISTYYSANLMIRHSVAHSSSRSRRLSSRMRCSAASRKMLLSSRLNDSCKVVLRRSVRY
jgi:predicted MFS family arabinose efflux permease